MDDALVTLSTRVNPNLSNEGALLIYVQPLIAGMVVWGTLQIVRRAGYALHRMSDAAEQNVAY